MRALLALCALSAALPLPAQVTARRAPIIDMHLHAPAADAQGPPPVPVCPGNGLFMTPARMDSVQMSDVITCDRPWRSPMTADEIMQRSLAIMERYNVIGVASGPTEVVRRWKAASPARIIVAVNEDAPLDSIRARVRSGEIKVIGELAFQYGGMAPDDPIVQRYFALAKELDVPLALHMGLGPPGAPYLGAPAYRMRLSNPLLLEETLVRNPTVRIYVMHAGWPMGDEMVALMWAHPQVYVDIGVISWAIPRAEFHRYLRRLMEAGFGKRVMFGSDQMVWADAIRVAIENVEAASFLSPAQKRDIFYNNAARFLHLPPGGATR